MISIIILVLFTLCINGDRQYSARQYAQRPRGRMGFKYNRQYAQKGGFGSVHYDNPSNSHQSQSQYPFEKGTSTGFGSVPPSNTDEPVISSTESTESYTFYGSTESTESTSTTSSTETTESTDSTEGPVADPTPNTEEEEEDNIDNTNTDQPFEIFSSNLEDIELVENENQEQTINDQHQAPIMNCLYDECAESFNACFNDQQCKGFMTEWQAKKSLRPECLAIVTSSNASPKIQEFEEEEEEEGTFETTSDATTTTTSTSTSTSIDDEQVPSECEYTQLFWDAYNCGVGNYCYDDQLKSAQSHQYLLSLSNSDTMNTASNASKSSANDWTLLMVALTAGIAAIIIFEVTRRLYSAFQDKIQCECQCPHRHSLRYIKNKWEQMSAYKYEKTHHDLDAIEQSDDAEMYGIGSSLSDKDESITKHEDTSGVTYNGPFNDSDISDDEELQKTSSKAMSLEEQTDDDQFAHNQLIVTEELIAGKDNEEEQKDREEEEEEITKEPVQQL